jgi:hypothetical protein
MKHSLQTAFKSWIGLTLLVIASLAAIHFRNGTTGLNLFIQQWPLSNLNRYNMVIARCIALHAG